MTELEIRKSALNWELEMVDYYYGKYLELNDPFMRSVYDEIIEKHNSNVEELRNYIKANEEEA